MPFFLDYLWKIIKSWETVISLFVGLFFLLIEVFSPYEIPIELYYVVFILTFLYASYSEYASLAGKVMPEMLDIKPRLKVHHFNGSRFSYKLVDTTFQTEDYQPVKADQPNADGKYPIVDLNVTSEKHNRLIPNAELKVFFQVENIGKTKAIILKMWGELSSITPFELGGAGVLFEDESYIDYPIPLNPYDERLSLVCNGKAIHQRHLSDEQFISRLKTLKKRGGKFALKIFVEFADTKGNNYTISKSCKVPVVHVTELYINYWSSHDFELEEEKTVTRDLL